MFVGLLEVFVSSVLLIISCYCYCLPKFHYWRKKNVPGPRSLPFSLNFASEIFRRISSHEYFAKLYREWRKYPFIGIYRGNAPALLVNDLDLIKTILIKDFHVFAGRGLVINENVNPLANHLLNLDGPKWKYMRTKLTPVFTSGKLKHMFELILECADHFENYLHDQAGRGETLEFREISAKFTTDVIGSCAFGISMNALATEDSEFRNAGRRIFQPSHWTLFKRLLAQSAPKLVNILGLKQIPDDIANFFISTIKETMEYRKRENIVRHDLVDTLIDIKNDHDNKEFEITDGMLTAQAFIFFLAGFETSSTTISFGLYELAYAPEIQEKLISEISKTLEKSNGKLSYEIVKGMKYLDMVTQEILRKNPPITLLMRHVFHKYTIPGTEVTLDTGTKVIIPLYGIHHDPEYYPHPEVFDPERFSDAAKTPRHPMAYLPFGDGPKNCIGSRFADFQVKLGLIKVFKNYRVKPSELLPFPYEIDKASVFLAPKGGVHVVLEKII